MILQRIFATFEATQYLCSGLGTTKKGSMKGLKKGLTKVVGVHESYPRLSLRKDIINICKHMIKINIMYFISWSMSSRKNVHFCRLFRWEIQARRAWQEIRKIIPFVLFNFDLTSLISLINVCSVISQILVAQDVKRNIIALDKRMSFLPFPFFFKFPTMVYPGVCLTSSEP